MSEFPPRTPVADDHVYGSPNHGGPVSEGQNFVAAQLNSGHQSVQETDTFATLKEEVRWSAKAFDEQLHESVSSLPLTDTSVELLDYVKSIHRCDPVTLANKISRDSQTSEVLLRIANTSVYNRSGRALSNVTDAIAHVGVKRMSELAVGASFLSLARPPRGTGFDAHLAWRRGLAAVLAADQILQWHRMGDESHSVMLCALMAPWGRMFTSTACAEMYSPMLVESHRSHRPLLSLEQELFARTPSAAMSHVLTAWGISAETCRPLTEADRSFPHLERLDASIQTRVQILKAAVLLGEFAVGEWLPWDEISFPTNMQLREIGAGAPREIVDLVRSQLQEEADLIRFMPNQPQPHKPQSSQSAEPGPAVELPYCNLALEVGELLPCLLESMGFQVLPSTTADPRARTGMLINCLHTPISWLAAKARDTRHSGWVMLTTEDYPPTWNWLGTFLQTPASYMTIRTACEQIIPRTDRSRENHSTAPHDPFQHHPASISLQHPPTAPATTSHTTQNAATYEPLNADA